MTTQKRLKELTGGLGKPSKMPGLSYGLPAIHCKTGAKLAKIEGTPCFNCYALKGNYQYPSVAMAQAARLKAIHSDDWVDAMVEYIPLLTSKLKRPKYFRWHDSGDIQSRAHFLKIIAIANALPDFKFWLPTQERDFVAGVTAPDNLVVRVSGSKVNGRAPNFHNTSTVITALWALPEGGWECPAPKQKNYCGDCRACWDKTVRSVSYHEH